MQRVQCVPRCTCQDFVDFNEILDILKYKKRHFPTIRYNNYPVLYYCVIYPIVALHGRQPWYKANPIVTVEAIMTS